MIELIKLLWKWLNDNGAALGVLVVFVPLAWACISFLSKKKRELAQQRFEIYHRLIEEIVSGRNGAPRQDSQIAAIYELRKFTEYFQVSHRILQHLHKTWAQLPGNERVVHEINLTLNFIRKKVRALETFK